MFVIACGGAQKAELNGYDDFHDEQHVFLESDALDVVKKMDAKESFCVYFGFGNCPWCEEALPVLNEVAKEYKQNVLYVNTRKKEEWKSNIDIDHYDELVEKIGDYLRLDKDGIKHLYTPHVFFVKKGEVVYEHEYTVSGHDAHERKMTDEERDELKAYYREGFEALKSYASFFIQQ